MEKRKEWSKVAGSIYKQKWNHTIRYKKGIQANSDGFNVPSWLSERGRNWEEIWSLLYFGEPERGRLVKKMQKDRKLRELILKIEGLCQQ